MAMSANEDKNEDFSDLEGLLDKLREAESAQGGVSVDAMLNTIGLRTYAPVLLVAGLLTLAPGISGVPGVPTVGALLVLAVAGQLLFGRERIWLPQVIRKRSIKQATYYKALEWMRPPSRFVDRFLSPRLTFLTYRRGGNVMAAVCLVIAIGIPVMEFVPFSANIAGAIFVGYGLALLAHDGLLALLTLAGTILSLGGALYFVL